MSDTLLIVASDFEFPRVIVWDALLDSELVSGWLAEALIVPEAGGEYNLHWVHHPGQPQSHGRITVFQPLERLVVDTSDGVLLTFELRELPGGSRGTSTNLSVAVDDSASGDATAASDVTRMRADWLTNLDQLEDLLRGHPVDWAHWNRDRHAAWARHLGEAQNSTA
ncbi:MAG: SRPBCC domain-containing protein [Rhodoglobus sp.]